MSPASKGAANDAARSWRRARIVTVGHSNRTLREFIALLVEERVEVVADVRKLRGSNAMPQFNERPLRTALLRSGIEYIPVPQLAGRRLASEAPSPRPCWQNRGFRNYAGHMGTSEFREGIGMLLALRRRVAVMCAEAVPWRCHRSLIADYLSLQLRRRVDELVGNRRRPHGRPAAHASSAESSPMTSPDPAAGLLLVEAAATSTWIRVASTPIAPPLVRWRLS